MKLNNIVFSIVVMSLLLACDPLISAIDSQSANDASAEQQILPKGLSFENQGKCRRVVDGDSLYVAGQDKQIRLWGVDAPETDEAGYQKAKDKLNKLAFNQKISCATQDIDKYGRIVARCFLPDGREINRLLLASGVSQEYCRFTKNYYGYCAY